MKKICIAVPSNGQGGCMVTMNILAQNKVDVLVIGGIGLRPLMGFRRQA